MRTLWRSGCDINKVGNEVRIIEVGDMKIVETAMIDTASFLERLKVGLQYIFTGAPRTMSTVICDEEFDKMCEMVVRGDESDK